jgi:cell division transport system permease protein
LEILDENIKKITQGINGLSGLFILIAILLINSSIRLSVYSKRLIIKTMQLVGATKRFIRRPFIVKHLQLGLIGALLSSTGLGYLIYELNLRFPELALMSDPKEPALIFSVIFAMGVIITGISTFFATQRFLNLTTDAAH